jgi:hypothetical protein
VDIGDGDGLVGGPDRQGQSQKNSEDGNFHNFHGINHLFGLASSVWLVSINPFPEKLNLRLKPAATSPAAIF